MILRYIVTIFALTLSAAASAQTLTSPPDVGTYTAVPVTYASGSTLNVLGDNSNAKGGTAPAFTTYPEPNDPTDRTLAAWTTAGWVTGGTVSYCLTNITDCPEKKFRIHFDSAKVLYDDPIKFYGQPGVSHCHEFFGNKDVNAYTTRASLRVKNSTTGGGGPAWANGYWESCWQKTISGKLYAIPAKWNSVYYAEPGTSPMVDDLQQLHLLFRFILGVNQGDPADCRAKNEINAANGGPGTGCNPIVAGLGNDRYQYLGNGFDGYMCVAPDGATGRALKAGLTFAPGFTLADGSDPWEGRCVDGDSIYAQANAPPCWDGVNVSSPDGVSHVRYEIADIVKNLHVCPNGWYRVPTFELKTLHITRGWADYSTWTLASDTMATAKCVALSQTCPTSPGWSFHADWLNGISKVIRDQVFSFCLGIGTNVPHQCNVGNEGATLSATQMLMYGNSPDGKRSPQVDLNRLIDSNDPTQLFLISTTRTGTHGMKGM